MLDVTVFTLQKILFEGKAKGVILPGEVGTFEILPFHKPILTRLVSGSLFVDAQRFAIRRGVAKVAFNRVTVIVELA